MNSRFALAVGTLSWMLTASLGAAPGPADLKAAPVPNRLGLTLHELKSNGELTELKDDNDLIARHAGRRYTNLVGRKET